jgi:lipoate-protein ligase A
VRDTALVLGSTQSDGDVDGAAVAASGLEVTRRRSGGGAVLVEPDALAWIDVFVPRHDLVWEQDVGRAFWWVGHVWADVLTALGVSGARVHQDPPVTSSLSSKVCFAGVGPGEVTVGGRKVVGMAQRRTRAGALFQCAALVRWDPHRLLGVLALTPPEREEGLLSLGAAAAGLGPAVGVADIEQSFVSHLP